MDQHIEQSISEQIHRFISNHESVNREQAWIADHLDDIKLKKIISTLSIVSLHTLSALKEHSKTGIELATELNVTRGGITRAAKSLTGHELVDTFKKSNDQKKIYYCLLDNGKKIADVHDQMHQMIDSELHIKIDSKYSNDELKLVNQFLTDMNDFQENLW